MSDVNVIYGTVPFNWNKMRLKHFYTLYSGGTPLASNDNNYNDEGVYFVNISDMTNTEYINETNKKITDEGIKDKNLRILDPGTILYSIYASIGSISELAINATISQAILALIPRLDNYIDKNYFKLQLMVIKENISYFSNGTTQNNLNADTVKKLPIIVPDITKQVAISTYVNNKISVINRIIKNQQQQIEKLKEYKQSLIREVVTKGLDPNVEFKESGIEWVGLIAKKSKLIQLKRLARISNGKEIRNVDGDIPVYGSGGIFKYTDEYLYEGESILYGRKGTIDKPLHVSGKFWTVDTMFYTEISKLVLPRYLYYVSVGSINFDYYKSGSVLPSMTQFELGNVLMPVFDIKSQNEIVKYLDHKSNMIDRLIELKYTKINNIEEYKKSLIYEYVTGKKEVS